MSTTEDTKVKRDRKRATTGKTVPFKLQPRHETFCQGIVAGLSQRDAYVTAGWTLNSTSQGRGPGFLLAKPEIQDHIATLQAFQRMRLNITMDSLILDLQSDRQEALRLGQVNAAINATMAIAKLLGLLVEKGHLDVNIISMPSDRPLAKTEYTVDEWVAEFSPKQITNGSNGHG